MSEAERVTVTVEGGVADVRLNRPEKIDALDLPVFEGLRSAARRVAADPSVHRQSEPDRGGAGVVRQARACFLGSWVGSEL